MTLFNIPSWFCGITIIENQGNIEWGNEEKHVYQYV